MHIWTGLYVFSWLSLCHAVRDDDIYTVQERADVFGIKTSRGLPEVDYVSLVRLPEGNSHEVRYRLRWNNRETDLTLTPTQRLFSPGCLVHHYNKDGGKSITPCNTDAHCYYSGSSDNHTDSWVTADVCNGMKGVIKLGGDMLYIHPDPHHSASLRSSVQPHIVYRYAATTNETCGTIDDYNDRPIFATHRQKRAVPKKYVETSLVIDPEMLNFHGHANIMEYVSIVFSIANKLYQEPSLGENIALSLIEILLVESYEEFGTNITEDASSTLNNFCAWHASLAHPQFIPDANILLTRLDLVLNGDPHVTGLAFPKGICQKGRNCAIVEDTGTYVGHGMAHEIGHLLGMYHDEDGINCTSGIMAKYGSSGSQAFTWSECSRKSLQHHLRTQGSSCLYNDPKQVDKTGMFSQDMPPGYTYDADEQCQLTFTMNASYMLLPQERQTPCANLVCQTMPGSDAIYNTAPLMDGTDINNTRIMCWGGVATVMNSSFNLPPIDGGFTDWAEDFGICSRSCGGGVKLKKRTCTNPRPRYGGKVCVGEDTKAVLCNVQTCPDDLIHRKCEFLRGPYPGLVWVPNIVDKTCKLRCVGTGVMRRLYNSATNLPTGTACDLDGLAEFSRCVGGICRKFGCDGHMDSGLVFDRCGTCNGTGSECIPVSGTYTKDDVAHNYTDVQILPTRASSVVIKEYNRFCSLSLLINGNRYLNAMFQAKTGMYTFDGISVQYTERAVINNQYASPETIRILGPLTKDVVVQVYRKYSSEHYVGVTPNITHEFFVPASQNTTQYTWTLSYASCSLSCDTGMRKGVVKCVTHDVEVPDYMCDLSTKPNESPIPCNSFACPAEWKTGKWSSCSESCGTGTKVRHVFCSRRLNGMDEPLRESHCNASTKPAVVDDACYIRRCPGIWKTGEYGQCSKSCGVGIKTRPVNCFRDANSTVPLQSEYCDSRNRPSTTNNCLDSHCYFSSNCTDEVQDCLEKYGNDICYGDYQKWAFAKCQNSCQVCLPCEDVHPVDCQVYINNRPGFCSKYGKWSQQNCAVSCGFCKECGPLPPVSNSVILGPIHHTPGSVVKYACADGYTISSGASTVRCETSGVWSSPPVCTAPCVNKRDNCYRYDTRTCHDPIYIPFWRDNCPKSCGFC